MLPILNRSKLISDFKILQSGGGSKHQLGVKSTLLCIVFALASTLESQQQSIQLFQCALDNLKGRKLQSASIELLQSLLLIVTYQQNHQMSVTSWTYHALAVKTAYQLGLQSPSNYKEYAVQESEMRKRLWYGLINQDRMLCICLGRPLLVPAHHVRTPKLRNPQATVNLLQMRSQQVESIEYYTNLTSLYELAASIIELLYNDNIDIEEPISAQSILAKRLPIHWQLENWRRQLGAKYRIISNDELALASAALSDDDRFRLVLSVHYYRIAILVNGPALVHVLSETLHKLHSSEDCEMLLENVVPVIRNEFSALRDLHKTVSTVLSLDQSFLDSNGVWFLLNYTCNIQYFFDD